MRAAAPPLAPAFCLGLLLACGSDAGSSPSGQEWKAPPSKAEPTAPKDDPKANAQAGPPLREDGTIYGESELMGTRVSINLHLGDETRAAEAGKAMQDALDEMARIESIMSEWKPGSELSRLNQAAGKEAVTVSAELFEILSRSRAISEATDGAFDITFHGVGQLWSFKPGSTPPTREAVAEKLPLVDWRQLELESAPAAESKGRARLAKSGMKAGLGAIAKGYAVDRAARLLVERGFVNHVVEAGGDTFAAGTKGGKAWMVGVQHPDRRGPIGVLPATDVAIVTSGDYQRFFEFEGKRYAHIIDPRTGWPVAEARSPKSVTLVTANATDADAYCTAVAVMGARAGIAFVETREELDAIVITSDDEVLVSSGLRDAFIPTEK